VDHPGKKTILLHSRLTILLKLTAVIMHNSRTLDFNSTKDPDRLSFTFRVLN
jgi:hypothetical protein